MIHPAKHSRAFTLIELMISVALVLILVLGINQVFKLTGQTIGAGQVSNAQQRDIRAAAKQMADDFAGAVSGGPCFIIGSSVQPAFRNANDAKTDADNLVLSTTPSQTQVDQTALTQDIQGTGTETTLSLVVPNSRIHRIDQLAFFARGNFHRQTGDVGAFVNSTAAQEAMINYGHLSVANNTVDSSTANTNDYSYYDPGRILDSTTTSNTLTPPFQSPTWPNGTKLGKNDNNLYASQWILGRSQILLKYPVTSDKVAYSSKVAGAYQPTLPPIVYGSYAYDSVATSQNINDTAIPSGSASAQYTVSSNRFDIAETSIDQVGASLANFIRSGGTNWWGPSGGVGSASGFLYRFRCNPFVTKPQTSRSTALATPAMLNSCTQFIVEFAGDFVTQDNDPTHVPGSGSPTLYGDVIDTKPDGVIDYVVVGLVPAAIAPFNLQRTVRWYGFPRDASSSGTIPGYQSAGNQRYNNALTNVVPLRDVLQTRLDPSTGTNTPNYVSSLEHFFGTNFVSAGAPPTAVTNYMTSLPPNNGGTYFSNQVPRYYAAWALGQYTITDTNGASPVINTYTNPPKMIRILITLDDPAGHLPDGQTFTYIFNLK